MGDYFVILKDIIYSFFPNLLIATKIKNFTCILKENYEPERILRGVGQLCTA